MANLHSWYKDRDANDGDCSWLCKKKYQAWCTTSLFDATVGGGTCTLNECVQPLPDATWRAVKGTHCWESHGASDLNFTSQVASLSACKTACLQTVGCEAISMFASSGRAGCYLKRDIRLHECASDPELDLYLYERSVNHRFQSARRHTVV